ncbi:uncharacterized protein MONBRDRAFT_9690 [Monosiga brevicollis MX1]|uniref:Transmembrane protein n=1 Tax=Monosiga brevicollis TaxID=81824 RepID=A9V3H3_MONBE|nr:uncharacterized protein MONBRDRAFT_9690 [Monosiga brevicollis MX1]EDQ87912.1 predicted protein [Monosiga brevicollis MX1]|eukprot:XP_001747445.1 hypothetical protein [Monosiga brevicollis MX1]
MYMRFTINTTSHFHRARPTTSGKWDGICTNGPWSPRSTPLVAPHPADRDPHTPTPTPTRSTMQRRRWVVAVVAGFLALAVVAAQGGEQDGGLQRDGEESCVEGTPGCGDASAATDRYALPAAKDDVDGEEEEQPTEACAADDVACYVRFERSASFIGPMRQGVRRLRRSRRRNSPSTILVLVGLGVLVLLYNLYKQKARLKEAHAQRSVLGPRGRRGSRFAAKAGASEDLTTGLRRTEQGLDAMSERLIRMQREIAAESRYYPHLHRPLDTADCSHLDSCEPVGVAKPELRASQRGSMIVSVPRPLKPNLGAILAEPRAERAGAPLDSASKISDAVPAHQPS